jgi:hypothetical protein
MLLNIHNEESLRIRNKNFHRSGPLMLLSEAAVRSTKKLTD